MHPRFLVSRGDNTNDIGYLAALEQTYNPFSKNLSKGCWTNFFFADCPEGAGGSPTSRVLTQTSDSLYNMTQRNLSDWLVKTVDRLVFSN